MAESNELEKIFKQHKLIPDILKVGPQEFLKATFANDLLADKGNELTPTQVKAEPKIEWSAEPEAFYTLIMTDPDAPSRKDPVYREYLHWLVVNIPGNAIDKGEILTAFVGSGPPEDTGWHRYAFLIFKQTGKTKFSENKIPKNSGKNRGNFNTLQFVKKYKLGNLIAGNFYQAQYDDYVPTVHRQLSGR